MIYEKNIVILDLHINLSKVIIKQYPHSMRCILFCIFLMISLYSHSQVSKERKVYIIAHRCNDLEKPGKALLQGVNWIEADFWHEDGKWHVSHDGIVKQDLDEWLKTKEKLSKQYKEQFALLIFDIKKKESISDLVKKVNTYLPADLNKVYSVSKIVNAEIFKEVASTLSALEMLSIDQEDQSLAVDSFFKSINFSRCLYGNGIDAMLLNVENYQKALKRASEIRDSSGAFLKTYIWTIERKITIKTFFTDCNVDGVIVNLNTAFKKPVKRALKICRKYNMLLAKRADLNSELKTHN